MMRPDSIRSASNAELLTLGYQKGGTFRRGETAETVARFRAQGCHTLIRRTGHKADGWVQVWYCRNESPVGGGK